MSNRRLLLGQINDQLGDGIALDKITFTTNNDYDICSADVQFNDDFVGGTPVKITIPSLTATYITRKGVAIQPDGNAWLDIDLGWNFINDNKKNGLFIGSSTIIDTFHEGSGVSSSGENLFPYYPWIFIEPQSAGTYYALPSTRPYKQANKPLIISGGFTKVVYNINNLSNETQLTINDKSYNFIETYQYYTDSDTYIYPLPNRSSSKMRLRFAGTHASFSFMAFSFLMSNNQVHVVQPFVRGGDKQDNITMNPEIGLYSVKTGKCVSMNFDGRQGHVQTCFYKNMNPSIIYY